MNTKSLTNASPAGSTGDIGHYAFEGFRLDLRSRLLFKDNVRVPVTTKAFDTLLALVRRHGQVVTKDELLGEVWPSTVVSEDSLTQNISLLRRVLEDDAAQPRFIATVARRGYRFIAPVVEDAEPPAAPVRPPPDPEPASPPVEVSTSSAVPAVRSPALKGVHWLGVGVLLVICGIAVGSLFNANRDGGVLEERRLRFVPDLPADSALASAGVVSPDARHVAFIARDRVSGETRLWIRTLSTGVARAIAGSEGASRPFWSPDSQAIGFFGGSRLRRVNLAGDALAVVCDTVIPRPVGGSWNEQDEILFADANALYLVPASGGEPHVVRQPSLQDNELAFAFPQFLPGGRRFLFEVTSTDPAQTGIHVGSLDQPLKVKVLDVAGAQVAYTKGYLLYVRDGRLFARGFDPESIRFAGEPFVVVDSTSANAGVSAATESVIAFGGGATEDVVEYDRNGQVLRTYGGAPPLRNLTLSPDQQALVGEAIDPGPSGIWFVDLERQVSTRLMGNGSWPLWLPATRTVAFTPTRDARPMGVYLRDMDAGTDKLLFRTPSRPIVSNASADGRTLAYTAVTSSETLQDIWIAPLQAEGMPSPLIASRAREIHPAISPDGQWIAYASDEEGTSFDVYVDAFPGLGRKRRVSMNGGTQPQWRADGKELFYLRADQTLMSVGVSAQRTGLELTPAHELFRPMLLGLMSDFRNQYTVNADGSAFYVGVARSGNAREPISLIVNWRGTTE